ncbi:MAG: ParB N-terminal domain-containing protein [Symploca sp. SIO2C1]|nr:ParB N-terminal domain-containing protein [Symploca sp. SIO2C1]
MKSNKAPTAVILFAGGGGVEAGMIDAGIEPILAVEYDPHKPELSSAIADAHEANFPQCQVIRRTVQEVASENFPGFPTEPDILWASPVCSNFSAAKRGGSEQDEDVEAANAVVAAINKLRPKHFFLENVPAYRKSSSWEKIASVLTTGGYRLQSEQVDMSNYGIPQARKRFIAWASTEDQRILTLPDNKPKVGWLEAIKDLIAFLPNTKLLKNQQKSVDEFLKTNKAQPLLISRVGGRSTSPAVPGSMPAHTVLRSHFTDGRCNNRSKFADIWFPYGHPKSLTIECVRRLQGFPDWYKFPESVAVAGSILGYSVPPKFVELFLKPLTTSIQDIQKFEEEMILSFGYTSDRFYQKTVTRRKWKERHAQQFIKAWREGKLIDAYDKSPRNGGKKIATIKLTTEPYQEALGDINSWEVAYEGYPELSKDEFIDKFFPGEDTKQLLWVIRFEVVSFAKNVECILQNVEKNNSEFFTSYSTFSSALNIAEIRRDGGTQPREKLDLNHVATLQEAIEDGAELDPVIVFYDGESYWLADGFHRCKASEESELEDIQVIIHQGTRRDAVLYSVGANAEHKAVKPRSRADKRRAVMMLLNDPEWSGWSNCEIARRCKVSDPFVLSLRKKLTSNIRGENDSQSRTYRTKHGTITTSSVMVGNKRSKDSFHGEVNHPDAPISGEGEQKINRPANRWYGGKWRVGKWIASHFPEHKIYVEPFGGMYSVGILKPSSEIEVYNDIHPEAVNFWQQLKDNSEELIQRIEALTFNETTVEWAKLPSADPLESASKFYVQCRITYTGGGTGWASGYSSKALGKPENDDHSHLRAITSRIKDIQVYQLDALEIIKRFDSPDTLFYCDPPYIQDTRNSHTPYEYEYSIEQHIQLIETVRSIKGKAIISGYPSSKYASLLKGWHRKETTSRATSGKDTMECLWIKPEIQVTDYVIGFVSNIDRMSVEQRICCRDRLFDQMSDEELEEAKSCIQQRLAAKLQPTTNGNGHSSVPLLGGGRGGLGK